MDLIAEFIFIVIIYFVFNIMMLESVLMYSIKNSTPFYLFFMGIVEGILLSFTGSFFVGVLYAYLSYRPNMVGFKKLEENAAKNDLFLELSTVYVLIKNANMIRLGLIVIVPIIAKAII